jgi:hypothetical protein
MTTQREEEMIYAALDIDKKISVELTILTPMDHRRREGHHFRSQRKQASNLNLQDAQASPGVQTWM